MKSVYEAYEQLTLEDFREMSPEEIGFWFSIKQQMEQIEQMRKSLIFGADVKEAKLIKLSERIPNFQD
jgi:hypothetical protein